MSSAYQLRESYCLALVKLQGRFRSVKYQRFPAQGVKCDNFQMSSKHPQITVMLLVASILSLFHLTQGSCNFHNNDPYYPSVEINSSIPGDVLPTGFNVTLLCVARKAEKFRGANKDIALVYQIFWFLGDRFILKCGGDLQKDKEEIKTCALNIINGSKDNSGLYQCQAGITYKCTLGQRSFTWKATKMPQFIVHPTSISTVPKSNETLMCEATGSPEPVIEWRKNNKPFKNAQTIRNQSRSYLLLHSVEPEKDDGSYSCVAKNVLGVKYSDEAVLRVRNVGQPISAESHVFWYLQPMNQTSSPGATVTFACSVRGSPAAQITWLKGGRKTFRGLQSQKAAGTSSLRLTNVTTSDQGAYACEVNITGKVLVSNTAYLYIKSVSTRQQIIPTPSSQSSPQCSSKKWFAAAVIACAVVLVSVITMFLVMSYIRKKKDSYNVQVCHKCRSSIKT